MALRADLERLQQEKGAAEAANREYEAKFERLRKERSMGTSFDGQGGGGSADRGRTAATTMGPMWTRGVSVGGGLRQSLSYVPRSVVPKFPAECPPYVYIAWERRFEVFTANQGLGHTISPDAPQITVISFVDKAYLFGHFGEALVTEHKRVWGYICEATAGAPFENRFYECHSISDALRTMREWALPLQPAERHLLVAQLEGVQFMGDEDPKFFFARIFRLETTMRAVDIEKRESELVQIILRQLPDRYDVVKTMTLADPQLTRSRLENTIRSAYSQRKAHEIAKQGPAAGARVEPRNRMLSSSAMVLGTAGPGEAEVNERTTVRYFAAVACRGSNSSSSNTGLTAVACRDSSSSSSNDLAAVVFLISINVAPMISLRPGRRNSSNRSSNRHGESIRSELAESTTAGATSGVLFPRLSTTPASPRVPFSVSSWTWSVGTKNTPAVQSTSCSSWMTTPTSGGPCSWGTRVALPLFTLSDMVRLRQAARGRSR